MGKENYSGSPEDLHSKGKGTEKMSEDAFVNPGTPQNPLVSMEDRKTGQVGGSANQKLKDRLAPGANDSWAMSKK